MIWTPEVNSHIPEKTAFEGGYVLGLDIGTNSIGWAVVGAALRDGKPPLLMGVRIFSEGTLKEKGVEQSRNAARREARQARRQGERRRRRWKTMAEILTRYQLLPADQAECARLQAGDPYDLRSKGLSERLEPYEIGRSIYHLGKRRGYKSSRKEEAKDDKETGVVKTAIGKLSEDMAAAEHKTLGQHFANIRKASPNEATAVRVRNHYISRDMVKEEFQALWNAQSKYHPQLLTEEAREGIERAIFHQRPLKPAKHLIGRCTLEPDESRAPNESWYVHEFRILQEVANMRILASSAGQEQALTTDQRAALLGELRRTPRELKFDRIKKRILKLGEFDRINLEEAERSGINGHAVEAGLSKVYKDRWKTDSAIIRDEIWENFIEMEDEEASEASNNGWNITRDQYQEMRRIRAGDGYSRYSLKAIKRLLPHLEKGDDLYTALQKEYPERAIELDVHDFLPPLDQKGIVNPVVTRALSETRKVVNALIAEYGKPTRIVVELARETKGSIKQRNDKIRINNANKREREKAEKALKDAGIKNTPYNILKYRLWEECEHRCPYTGKPIAFQELFGEIPRFDIEHILPYTLSYDNSYLNLTLCESRENRDRKQNRIPRDAYANDSSRFEEILQRVDHMKRMPYEKRKRFRAHEVSQDFKLRQITDTSYAAKELRKHLMLLGIDVKTTRGPVTSQLRRYWGLNSIIREVQKDENPASAETNDSADKKNRDDHRHHAVDAAVIAVTEPRHIQRLGRKYTEGNEFGIEAPWDTFRKDIRESIRSINVSQRPEHKLAGGFCKETNYGLYEKGPHQGKFVRRVPVESLKPPMLDRICDEGVRKVIEQRLRDLGVNFEKPTGKGNGAKEDKIKNFPVGWCNEKESGELNLRMPCRKGQGPLIRRVRVWENRTKMIPVDNATRFLEPENNHHLAVYAPPNSVKPKGLNYVVCSRYEAMKRKLDASPIVSKSGSDSSDTKLLLWLMKNDTVICDCKDGKKRLFWVQKISAPEGKLDITLRLHTESLIDPKVHPKAGKEPQRLRLSSLILDGKLRLQKVTVDPLGRIWPCNDAPDH